MANLLIEAEQFTQTRPMLWKFYTISWSQLIR